MLSRSGRVDVQGDERGWNRVLRVTASVYRRYTDRITQAEGSDEPTRSEFPCEE